MAKKKKTEVTDDKVKLPIINLPIKKKKKKKSKVAAQNVESLTFNMSSFFTPANENVRHSLFTRNVSDVTNTSVNNIAISTSKQSSFSLVPCSSKKSANDVFSNLLESVKFFDLGGSKIIALCEYPEEIYFYGVVKLTVLFGKVDIFGYTFNEKTSPYNVFSLKDSGLLGISILQNARSVLNLQEIKEKVEEKCPSITPDMINDITSNMTLRSVLVLLERSKDVLKMKTLLNTHCKSTIFPMPSSIDERLFELNHTENILNIEKALTCQFVRRSEKVKFLIVNPEWQHLITQIVEASSQQDSENVILLAGGKGVGKSTLLRYTINKCLSETQKKKVLLIDLDPGQCELTLPGCVSVTLVNKPLLGPNFTHLTHSGRSWFLGDISVTQCLDKYLESLQLILSYCSSNAEFLGIPWLINTMGFCKGLGVELMSCVIYYLRPTHVIQIQSVKNKNNYPKLLSPENVLCYDRFINKSISRKPGNLNYIVSVINSVALVDANSTNPPERRGAVILSYFSETLPQANSSLTDVVPFVTELSHLRIIVCHVKYLNRAQSLAAINGNLVALCNMTSAVGELQHSCLGFGIVRGVDFEDGRLYLITPLTHGLKNVNCLMMGNVFLPTSVYLRSHSSGHVPYVNVGEGQITSKVTKRSFKPAASTSFHERFGDESRMK